MKSIRLSLMLYFLGLLAVALTTASLLVYRNAEQTLQSKQQAMAQLIQAQYEDGRRDVESHLDENLLFQAQYLAGLVQVQFDRHRAAMIQSLYLLLGVSSAHNPSGYLLAPTWIAEGAPPLSTPAPPRGEGTANREEPGRRSPSRRPPPVRFEPSTPVYLEFRNRLFNVVKLKRDELVLPGDGRGCDYFQIDNPPGKSYFSPSMAGRSFPPPATAFGPNQLVHWYFEDARLDPNIPVRRVVFKASGVDVASVWSGRPNASGGSERARPPEIHRFSGPTIYVHCAAETHKRDAALKQLSQRRDDELAKVADETRASLADLRAWLLAISLAVFAATGGGGFWLVRLGLSPLHRLSEAVSRVSAKDFRLPLGEQSLPLELRPIAQRLTGTFDLLKRAFAREKQAAADISHELRTPLAALLTTAEFALRKPRSTEQYRELFGDCLTSAQQMNQIVERLLTLARLDAGVDRLRVQPVDVATLTRECAAMIRPLTEARGLRLTIKNSPLYSTKPREDANDDNACLIQADPDKLREVVTNLLHNAVEYNRPGGAVDLRVVRENGTLEVEVEDTGIGIAPDAREHIFERFYRADPSRGGDDLHAGLGLAIVKEYIDLMGGSIGVESREGQGSTFRIVLPVHN
jgi:signal transduction histidine kinase